MIYDNLIINDSIWTKLRNMQNANTIPHAILFHGSNGSGKEGHAIEFASMLNLSHSILAMFENNMFLTLKHQCSTFESLQII